MAKKKAAKAKSRATRSKAPARMAKPRKGHAANGDTRVERARYTRPLPCKIDAEAKAEKADELAVVIREREELLVEKRETLAEYRAKLTAYDEKFLALATSVEKSTEDQDVVCVDVLDVKRNQVDVIRQDTGEVVETRTAKKEELQEILFEEDAKRSAEGNAKEAARAAKLEKEQRKPRRRQAKPGEDITAPADLLAADEASEKKTNGKPETLPEIVNREVADAFKGVE